MEKFEIWKSRIPLLAPNYCVFYDIKSHVTTRRQKFRQNTSMLSIARPNVEHVMFFAQASPDNQRVMEEARPTPDEFIDACGTVVKHGCRRDEFIKRHTSEP